MKSDMWSLGTTLLELMGIRPYSWSDNDGLPTMNGRFELPFKADTIKSSELADFLKECLVDYFRWSVKELMNVSVMG